MSQTVGVRQLLDAAAERLAAAGVSSPGHDATTLLAHVLDRPASGLLAADPALPETALARFAALLAERADRVPLQHLTGVAGFRYLDLAVGPGVFVPRPETELLAGWAIEALAGHRAPAVADLCCGCGAIALALANELPRASVWAVELDPMALAWARRNADVRAAAGDRPIDLVGGDAADPAVLADLDGTLTAVVMNPPYVPDDAIVAREVAEHDPPLALWGGPDGLDVVRRLLHRAAALLEPGGLLGTEHADLQGESMPALVAAHGAFVDVVDHRDLNDRPRFTTARRR
ncbi:MAG: peptide chain release factor N(5)-glutamine methyltransferase [Geodermatophilaceae bacterium]|nr:peptide chain release factor N(5)-glutamine methyltransferase [Geodermatophilaceae bacterium]